HAQRERHRATEVDLGFAGRIGSGRVKEVNDGFWGLRWAAREFGTPQAGAVSQIASIWCKSTHQPEHCKNNPDKNQNSVRKIGGDSAPLAALWRRLGLAGAAAGQRGNAAAGGGPDAALE